MPRKCCHVDPQLVIASWEPVLVVQDNRCPDVPCDVDERRLERHMHTRTDASSEPEGDGEVAIDHAIPISCYLLRSEETRRVGRLWIFK